MLTDGGTFEAPIEGVTVTARFEDGILSGSSGCNTYSTTYELDGSSLTIGPDIAGTAVACPAAETAVETAYLEQITAVSSYTIDGATLRLSGADGASLLEYRTTTADDILGSWTVNRLLHRRRRDLPDRRSHTHGDLRCGVGGGRDRMQLVQRAVPSRRGQHRDRTARLDTGRVPDRGARPAGAELPSGLGARHLVCGDG
jgi:hypothetical protein